MEPRRDASLEREKTYHDGDTSGVKLLDDVLGRNSDSTDEQGGLLLDDHVDKLRKLSLCKRRRRESKNHGQHDGRDAGQRGGKTHWSNHSWSGER